MASVGHILIADDEQTFRDSAADRLRREGYQCTCAPDAIEAAKLLRRDDYDLLIADIRMPGNADLEFVKALPKIAEGMPVILATAYPSQDSAIESIQLPVAAYLVKPIDFDELVAKVKMSISDHRVYHTVREAHRRLEAWSRELDGMSRLMKTTGGAASPVHLNAFMLLTLGHIVDALLDVKHMVETVSAQHGVEDACRLYDCPRLGVLLDSLVESIETLEKTKSAFKSRQLGDLRRKLERILESATHDGAGAARSPGNSSAPAAPRHLQEGKQPHPAPRLGTG